MTLAYQKNIWHIGIQILYIWSMKQNRMRVHNIKGLICVMCSVWYADQSTRKRTLCSASIFGTLCTAAIFGPNSAVEYANILQLHCLCKSSTQLFFVFDNSGLVWIWKENFIFSKAPPPRVGKKWDPRNPVPSPFLAKIRKVNQDSESRREFWKLSNKLCSGVYWGNSVPRVILGRTLNFEARNKLWKSHCSVGLSAEPRRRNFFRKTCFSLPPPDNPPNLPSVQNNRFPCCFENLLHSGILHFFPFPDNPLNSGTIYGALYYLPHLLTFPRKSKNHTIHRRLLSNWNIKVEVEVDIKKMFMEE